jgi:MEDS: MEthanogen/methylotroph, DcmR Sensory domain
MRLHRGLCPHSQVAAVASGHTRPDGPSDGQLDVCRLPESTYLAGGRFTASDMLTFWTEAIVRAEADGYSLCRLAGEMTWALRDAPGWSIWSATNRS